MLPFRRFRIYYVDPSMSLYITAIIKTQDSRKNAPSVLDTMGWTSVEL
jgi:hypothetical protein